MLEPVDWGAVVAVPLQEAALQPRLKAFCQARVPGRAGHLEDAGPLLDRALLVHVPRQPVNNCLVEDVELALAHLPQRG